MKKPLEKPVTHDTDYEKEKTVNEIDENLDQIIGFTALLDTLLEKNKLDIETITSVMIDALTSVQSVSQNNRKAGLFLKSITRKIKSIQDLNRSLSDLKPIYSSTDENIIKQEKIDGEISSFQYQIDRLMNDLQKDSELINIPHTVTLIKFFQDKIKELKDDS